MPKTDLHARKYHIEELYGRGWEYRGPFSPCTVLFFKDGETCIMDELIRGQTFQPTMRFHHSDIGKMIYIQKGSSR